MKKVLLLILTAGLMFSAVNNAQAIEFKTKGMWIFDFDYVSGGNFMSKTRAGRNVSGQQWNSFRVPRDNFWSAERVVLQLEAIASENLSGTVRLEIGDMAFGDARVGGALGTDGTNII
ncbi:MAG: hypothetical protein RRY29_02580, partial [Desulfovibrionaceae bacterium]